MDSKENQCKCQIRPLGVGLPKQDNSISLSELDQVWCRGEQNDFPTDFKCENCEARGQTKREVQLSGASKYMVIQAIRCMPILYREGKDIFDQEGHLMQEKIDTKIDFPGDVVDLSALLPGGQKVAYELFGMTTHHGARSVYTSSAK